jgi:surface protein
LDVSNWVTSSLGTGGKAGTALFHAFDRCEALTTIDASGWDVSNVTVFQQMFKNCYALNNLTVTEWDMSSAVSTTEMFRDCQALTSLDLGSWEPSSLITTQSMFYGCDVLTTIGDISGWITGNITNAQYMFYGCDALTVDVIGLTFGAGNISSMFQGASGTGEVSGYETWDVSNATQFQYVFYGGNNCKVFPETWNMTSSINNLGTFRNWNTLTGSIDCSAMEFGPTTQMSQMFRRLPNSTALTDITFGPDCDFSATTTLDYFLSGHTGLTDITWDAAVSFAALTRANTMLTSGGKMSVSSYDHFLDRMQVTWSAAITPVAPLGCGSSQYTKSILTTGTATSTTANKLVDSGKDFSASGLNVQIGDIVFDDTGNDYAKVTAVDNATTLSLNADIIISGDAYEIDQGAAAKDKEYLIDNGWTIVDANGTSP